MAESLYLKGKLSIMPAAEPAALTSLLATENGDYTPPAGYDGFNDVTVNVPTIPAQLTGLTVTSNGDYTPPAGYDGFDEVNVNVPQSAARLTTLSATANGNYTPPTGYDGFDEVYVNVPTPSGALFQKSMTPGAIASFDDGADMVLPSLTASIVPVQAGSGDPSPTNVRPISGFTETNVTKCGKNFFDKDHYKFAKGYLDGNGEWQGSKTIYDYPTEGLSYWSSVIIDVTKFGTDTITYSGFVSVTGTLRGIVDENFTRLAYLGGSATASYTVDLSQYPTAKYIVLSFMRDNHDFSNAQLEIGSTATTYEPYAGTTTTIPFTDGQGQSVTVYGGDIDVINGVVTPCPYYASYNGEQLTGEWISDRDVYSPNTSPTIGAQVVNIGATGTAFYTQPTAVKSRKGVNNILCNSGNILSGTYLSEEV